MGSGRGHRRFVCGRALLQLLFPSSAFYALSHRYAKLGGPFAFLVTAVVASHLSTSAKQRALEAMQRRDEMERLYELSRRADAG